MSQRSHVLTARRGEVRMAFGCSTTAQQRTISSIGCSKRSVGRAANSIRLANDSIRRANDWMAGAQDSIRGARASVGRARHLIRRTSDSLRRMTDRPRNAGRQILMHTRQDPPPRSFAGVGRAVGRTLDSVATGVVRVTSIRRQERVTRACIRPGHERHRSRSRLHPLTDRRESTAQCRLSLTGDALSSASWLLRTVQRHVAPGCESLRWTG